MEKFYSSKVLLKMVGGRDASSDGIQNFKNRFSFVSYFLTTGSFIKVSCL